jgi:hypothetical protein
MNPVCPYCNAGIEPDSPDRTNCTACGVAHHAECWAENGGCTVFGCSAAPPEEPKVTVGHAELQSYAPPPPPPARALTAPPPPPPRVFAAPPPAVIQNLPAAASLPDGRLSDPALNGGLQPMAGQGVESWGGLPAPNVQAQTPIPAPPQRSAQDTYLSIGGYNPPPLPYWQPPPPAPPKNRVVFILLGIFLGFFGAHNFYAGYTGRGAIQLSITIGTLFVGSIVSWIWAIVEVCIVDRDSQNVEMI